MSERMDESAALAQLSARIGANRTLAQAAGGNISIKLGDTLRVKASGMRLADAATREIFVDVDLPALVAAFEANETHEDYRRFVTAGTLKPSIETTFHAVLHFPVVLHVHCVETLALAVRQDAEDCLAERLEGLDWAFIPYAMPGEPLTHDILGRHPEAPIQIMGNHGLIVGGDTVEDAAKRLEKTSARLRSPVRPCPPPDDNRLATLADGTAFVPADEPEHHALATDPGRLAIARRGTLYPDHVVFLGPGIAVADPDTLREAVDDWSRAAGMAAPCVLVPGVGTLVRPDLGDSARALLTCLADVTGRIPPDAPVRVLTPDQEHALMNWDAEAYRRALETGGRS